MTWQVFLDSCCQELRVQANVQLHLASMICANRPQEKLQNYQPELPENKVVIMYEFSVNCMET